jgi:hypothetical protein
MLTSWKQKIRRRAGNDLKPSCTLIHCRYRIEDVPANRRDRPDPSSTFPYTDQWHGPGHRAGCRSVRRREKNAVVPVESVVEVGGCGNSIGLSEELLEDGLRLLVWRFSSSYCNRPVIILPAPLPSANANDFRSWQRAPPIDPSL